MTRRLISFLFAVAVLCSCMTVTAFAAENTDWIELLETATVNDSGNNLFTLAATSGTFRIKTPQYMRCTKVDMVLAHPSGYTPTSVRVRYNNAYYTLTLQKIDAYTTRVYGANIPDTLYADLVFQINKSSTSSVAYQILSCKVTASSASAYNATAYSEVAGVTHYVPFALEELGDSEAADIHGHFQFPVVVTDWQKFDKIVISGSVGGMALNSVRATINGLGLPFEMSYAVSNTSGSESHYIAWNEMKYYTYSESYQGTTDGSIFEYTSYLGKVLFTITIDLSGVDRTQSSEHELYCYFTTLVSDWLGYTIQIMEVKGLIETADTSNVSWWTKITTFLTDLMNGDSGASDAFQTDAEQQGGEMDDLNNELQNVTKPPVEDIETDIDSYVPTADQTIATDALGILMGNSLITSVLMIVLTIALIGYILYGKR